MGKELHLQIENDGSSECSLCSCEAEQYRYYLEHQQHSHELARENLYQNTDQRHCNTLSPQLADGRCTSKHRCVNGCRSGCKNGCKSSCKAQNGREGGTLPHDYSHELRCSHVHSPTCSHLFLHTPSGKRYSPSDKRNSPSGTRNSPSCKRFSWGGRGNMINSLTMDDQKESTSGENECLDERKGSIHYFIKAVWISRILLLLILNYLQLN